MYQECKACLLNVFKQLFGLIKINNYPFPCGEQPSSSGGNQENRASGARTSYATFSTSFNLECETDEKPKRKKEIIPNANNAII